MLCRVDKMVLPLAPVKFYGGSLPRPWIYGDVKFNSERIDPPLPPSAPLLSWANEALWSMGGLSSKRKRMQGKIEGSIKKLRAIEEEEEEAEDLAVSGDFEASKSSTARATIADEGINTSGMETNVKPSEKGSSGARTQANPSEKDSSGVRAQANPSEKGSSGVRTQAKKSIQRDPSSDKVQKSDQGTSGFVEAFGNIKAAEDNVGIRVSPRNKKRKGESENAGVEPETRKDDKSARRSGRIASPAMASSRVCTRSSGSRLVAAV